MHCCSSYGSCWPHSKARCKSELIDLYIFVIVKNHNDDKNNINLAKFTQQIWNYFGIYNWKLNANKLERNDENWFQKKEKLMRSTNKFK